MIYAIRTTWYDTDTKEITDLIKIGFTKDGREKIRFIDYKIHNPLYKLLYTIPGATQEDEADLHYYFKDLNVVGEWFRYDKELIDFFEAVRTKESLDKALSGKYYPGAVTSKTHAVIYRYVKKVINRWLCLISTKDNVSDYYDKLDNCIDNCMGQVRHLIYQESDVIPYLVKTYNIPGDIQKGITDFMEGNLGNSKNVSDFLQLFQNTEGFPEKMKLLCTYGLSEPELCVVLDQIPLQFKTYYNLLGPERLKANGYNITRAKKELAKDVTEKLNNSGEMQKNKPYIVSSFSVGSKYTLDNIKSILSSIYSQTGYNKTPRATDINEFFETKKALITVDKKKKRVCALRIIKLKEG